MSSDATRTPPASMDRRVVYEGVVAVPIEQEHPSAVRVFRASPPRYLEHVGQSLRFSCSPKKGLVHEALQLRQQGDRRAAEILMERILREAPDDDAGLCCRAFLAALDGDCALAESAFEQALAIHQDNANVLQAFGLFCMVSYKDDLNR